MIQREMFFYPSIDMPIVDIYDQAIPCIEKFNEKKKYYNFTNRIAYVALSCTYIIDKGEFVCT